MLRPVVVTSRLMFWMIADCYLVVNRFFIKRFTICRHIFRTDIARLPLHFCPSRNRCATNRAEIIALFKVYAIIAGFHCVASLVLCVVSIKQMYSNASLIAIALNVKDCNKGATVPPFYMANDQARNGGIKQKQQGMWQWMMSLGADCRARRSISSFSPLQLQTCGSFQTSPLSPKNGFVPKFFRNPWGFWKISIPNTTG